MRLSDEIRKTLKWRMTTTTSSIVKEMLARIGFKHTNKTTWIGQWGMHMKSESFRKILPHQKVNHFPGSFKIGRKDLLWKSISQMQVLHGKKNFDFLPECFLLQKDYKRLKSAWDACKANTKWIHKPNASARGIGIHVSTNKQDIPCELALLLITV